MAVIPERDAGFFVAVNASSDVAIDRFLTVTLERASTGVAELRPSHQIEVSQFAGEYRSNRYDRTSVEKLSRMEVHNIEATNGEILTFWHDGAVNTYQAVDRLVFQNVASASRFLVFEEDEDEHVTHAFFNDRIAGGYVPVVWEKNDFWNSNQYVNEYFGFVGLFALGYVLFPLGIIVRIVRAMRYGARPAPRARQSGRRWMNTAGIVTSALLLAYVWLYFVPLLRARADLVFGMPSSLTPWESLSWFIVSGFAAFAALWLHAVWRSRQGWPGLVFGFACLASGALVCEFLLRWNFLFRATAG